MDKDGKIEKIDKVLIEQKEDTTDHFGSTNFQL